MRFALSSLLSLGIAFFLATAATDQPNAGKQSAVNIPALIDKLVEVADSDIGYSATVTGKSFLPVDSSAQVEMALLSEKPHIPSETIREIVKQGAAAVPHLIAHLGDQRKTKIIVRHDDGMGTFYGDEFDYNIRTTKPPALPARQEDEKEEDKEEEDGLTKLFGPVANDPHTITVGDLCFVALGQIVNRRFNAVRYQPTGFTILSSPTHSPALLAAVKQEWGKLTPERHRASLIADFLKPDSEARRKGACTRLAYYYPDALEALVVPFLAQPTYGYSAYDVRSFVRETLYQTKDARKRRELLDRYLAKEGPGARDGILQQLFDDLRILEGYEAMRIWPPLNGYGRKPRELLIELFGYDKKVHSSQRPPPPSGISASEKAQLIDKGLIYDHSVKIDRAVRDVSASIPVDDYLALACMRRLVGRGYDAAIEKYCRRRIPQLNGEDRIELEKMLDRLGWNLVHVAVERHDRDGLSALNAADTTAGEYYERTLVWYAGRIARPD